MLNDKSNTVGTHIVTVPRGLLDLCLGIIEEVQKHYQTSSNFDEDVRLAIAQLKFALSPSHGDGGGRASAGIDAAAKYLAETVASYRWDGLSQESRAEDRGYRAWGVYGHANAGREDYRDVVRRIIQIAPSPPSPSSQGTETGKSAGDIDAERLRRRNLWSGRVPE